MLAILSLSGCPDKSEDRARVTPIRGGYVAPWEQQQMGSFNGQIGTQAAYGQEFTESVRGLYSMVLPEEYVGPVSPTDGVRFFGQVRANGPISQAVNSGMRLDISAGRLAIQARDQWGGSNVEPLPAIPYDNASGYISGNYAEIRFSNPRGAVLLRGQFNQQEFIGVVEYENSYQANTGGAASGYGAAGTLGDFRVPTCQFFSCN
jgi:hypothetical protein